LVIPPKRRRILLFSDSKDRPGAEKSLVYESLSLYYGQFSMVTLPSGILKLYPPLLGVILVIDTPERVSIKILPFLE
jgi:hypothetical protein